MASPLASPRATPNEEPPARGRIVAAAAEIFGRFGFKKATVQEIVAAAHVSKPLFYRQFRDKQDVFETVVDRVFTDWRRALVDRVASSGGGTEVALRDLFVAALDYGRERPLLGRLLSRDAQLMLSTQSDVWEDACDALRQLIAETLREGLRRGEVRSDLPIETMADLLTEMTMVFANRQLLSGRAVAPDEAEAVVACMLGGVLASHE